MANGDTAPIILLGFGVDQTVDPRNIITIGYASSAVVPVTGPFCPEAMQLFQAGAVARQRFEAGAVADQAFQAGAEAQQVTCQ